MNSDARTAFRQAEIRAVNEEAAAEADARDQARSDFRRREIEEMNVGGDGGKMATWGLLGLLGVLVLSLVMQPSRSRK